MVALATCALRALLCSIRGGVDVWPDTEARAHAVVRGAGVRLDSLIHTEYAIPFALLQAVVVV
jgi:hypothetical protein